MIAKPAFTLREVDWTVDRDALRAVRWKVFVEEQRVPEDEEWDDYDPVSRHVIAAAADGAPVGTGRLLPDGHVGRMAVLKEWRGRGVGGGSSGSTMAGGSANADSVRSKRPPPKNRPRCAASVRTAPDRIRTTDTAVAALRLLTTTE